ncbi:hypothetical protein F5B21DRAFT_44714 [Xylaria acuta]|nr:hypothetical protein F5B21DRAFT_44714 [Xylaria acuta]
MFFKTLLRLALANAAVYAIALPELAGTTIVARDVPADPISKYTTQWFLDNVCNPPDTPADCLFYTKGLSRHAQEFAADPDSFLKTIWEMWDPSLYNDDVNDLNNPLRDIMGDDQLRFDYFSNMSRAMANMCDFKAAVMDKNYPDVRLDGIWGQVEFVQLQRDDGKGKVNLVTAISLDGTQETTVWTRPGTRKRSGSVSHTPRQGTCGTNGDVSARFDEGGRSPVDW